MNQKKKILSDYVLRSRRQLPKFESGNLDKEGSLQKKSSEKIQRRDKGAGKTGLGGEEGRRKRVLHPRITTLLREVLRVTTY